MTRRLLGPVAGPVVLFLVAGLVFAGLGWVTVAALRVEAAHREAARAADREKAYRTVLLRLDARMLPALGVEDSRAFHEFKSFSADDPVTIYGPASAPLLVGDLPDWMQLHFQLDPEAAWESPQVLTAAQRTALRRYWPTMPLRNATKPREVQLLALNEKFPAKLVGETFAARDRALPPVVSPIAPASTHTSGLVDGDGTEPRGAEWAERERFDNFGLSREKEIPLGSDSTPAEPKPAPGREAGADAVKESKNSALGAVPQSIRKAEDEGAAVPQTAPAPKAALAPQSGAGIGVEQQTKADPAKRRYATNPSDYDQRQTLLDKSLGDKAYFPYSLIPRTAVRSQKPSAESASGGADRFRADGIMKETEFAKRLPNADMKKVESDPYAFNRLLNELRSKARELDQMDRLHRGNLDGASSKEQKADEKLKDLERSGASRGGAAFGAPMKGASAAPAAPAGPAGPHALPKKPDANGLLGRPLVAAPGGAPAAGLPAGGGLGGGFNPPDSRLRRAVPDPVPATPDPEPPAMLIPAELPPAAMDDMVAPPLAVHLGTLRPQWLTAPDGTPLLVLVRTARVENRKTVYQGVVLDWEKLQAVLRDEVKDVFPDATLVPVKDQNNSELREQSMAALPVRLDPGPEPELPPAGWTPLRIGLVLAWAAAAIAFAAIGLTGWSLVDLADRRIRFVSAVTHELRTPLTSLRLYLDLLLSGMVQDEEKRREYLSTLNVESDRLHRLIDNVLDFAKLERNRKGRELVPVKAVDLVDLIRLTWTDRALADGKELVVEHELTVDLGLLTDGSLVQQIVGNLIDNARKYTRESADARIWLRVKADGSRLVFEVEDRGPGVPAGEQKTIFRPFRRGETADTKAGGAGLGLALSKEWAEVLGGRLSYVSPAGGVGSCFRLELPIRV